MVIFLLNNCFILPVINSYPDIAMTIKNIKGAIMLSEGTKCSTAYPNPKSTIDVISICIALFSHKGLTLHY